MNKRLENLDALRGVAVMTVLIQHLWGELWRALPGSLGWLKVIGLDYFDWGRFGVILFFLTSGYVIPLSFSGPTPVRKFVVSRICRLYPAFWISVLAMTACLYLSGHAVPWRQFLANFTMAYPAFDEEALTGVYWTLMIELMFYALSGGLYIIGCLARPSVLGALALLGIASAAVPMAGNAYGLHLPVLFQGYHLSFLLLGSLIRLHFTKITGARTMMFLVMASIALTLPLVTGMLTGEHTEYSAALPVGVFACVGAAIVVFLLFWRPGAMNQPQWLVALGAWSYSIYLLHEPIRVLISKFVTIDSLASAVVFAASIFVSSIAAAAIVYTVVEKPAIALGRRFAKGSSAPASAVENAP